VSGGESTPPDPSSAGADEAKSGSGALSSHVSDGSFLLYLLTGLSVVVTLILVGQPLYANDTWIHLALGRAFASAGPFLDADPYLFAAPGPPAPSSWLGSLALYAVQSVTGFAGLRVFHVAAVGMLFALVWRFARRATRSAPAASVVLVAFLLLSTYRIVQLRPHLFTMVAMFVVAALVLEPRRGPSRGKIAMAAGLTALWANVHAAFLLGPLLVLGASASLALLAWVPGLGAVDSAEVDLERGRAGRLALAGLAMLLASGLNPQLWTAHLAFFSAGETTLALSAVVDEWGPTNLLAWPPARLPPTWATWLLCWCCLVIVVVAGIGLAWNRLGPRLGRLAPAWTARIDPVLYALATASVLASVMANRFLWLLVFAVTLAASTLPDFSGQRRRAWGAVLLIVVMAGGHLRYGDWPLVSRALQSGQVAYGEPYRAAKYFGHSIWFLADTGLEGRVYNDYPLGGFMSFWLGPKLQMSSSGTMNVAADAMDRNFAIEARRSDFEGLEFGALLDRQGIDVFLATGLPVESGSQRPVSSTLRHLEREPGWILAFRSLRSAVYVRGGEAANQNLDRIVAYYQAAGVPFDRTRGLDVARVIDLAPRWAMDQGLIPADFDALREKALRQSDPDAAARLADLYAVLGLYEPCREVGARLLRAAPRDEEGRYRQAWCQMMSVANNADGAGLPESLRALPLPERRGVLARLPLFEVDRARSLQRGISPDRARR